MTAHQIDLAVAFLQSQPGSAAAVLEEQPMEQVASFLQSIPYKQSATALKMMLPQYTARLFKFLEPVTCAGFLSEMEISHIASILRNSDHDINTKILELLPERTRLACNLLLNYPETAVGAWMSTNFLLLPADCTVGEARARVLSAENIVILESVFVVDRERRLHGEAYVVDIFKEPSRRLISSIMKTDLDTISGHTSLLSVSNDSLWHRTECVAVINSNHQLVGLLRHLDLRKGLNDISTTIDELKGSDPITGVLKVYGSSLVALFNTVSDALNIRKP